MANSLSRKHLKSDHGKESTFPTFRRLLFEGVKKNRNGRALVSLYQPENHLPGLAAQSETNVGHTAWTYNGLQQAASRLAIGLHGRGVREGSVVAAFL